MGRRWGMCLRYPHSLGATQHKHYFNLVFFEAMVSLWSRWDIYLGVWVLPISTNVNAFTKSKYFTHPRIFKQVWKSMRVWSGNFSDRLVWIHIPYNNKKYSYWLSSLHIIISGKLVTLKGTVIKVGSVGLICTSMAFECSGCHNVQAVIQPQGVFTGIVHRYK